MNYTNMEFIDFKNKHPNTVYCNRQKFTGKNCHRHAYYEIEIVVNGSGSHIINGNQYQEKTGDVFIMRLTDFHEFKHEKETENWVIEIPPSYISGELANMMMLVNGDIITNLTGESFEHAKDLYCMIEKLKDKKDKFYDLFKQNLTASLILYILDHTDKNISRKYSRDNERMRDIIEYINQNISSPELTINSIASNFYINKGYLSALFKKNMGITLVAYIRKIRLSNASMMLASTNKKIIEVCELSGFNSISSFLREFKKEYGISPTEMRRKNEGKNIDDGENTH